VKVVYLLIAPNIVILHSEEMWASAVRFWELTSAEIFFSLSLPISLARQACADGSARLSPDVSNVLPVMGSLWTELVRLQTT
jgi:hypothetical protein